MKFWRSRTDHVMDVLDKVRSLLGNEFQPTAPHQLHIGINLGRLLLTAMNVDRTANVHLVTDAAGNIATRCKQKVIDIHGIRPMSPAWQAYIMDDDDENYMHALIGGIGALFRTAEQLMADGHIPEREHIPLLDDLLKDDLLSPHLMHALCASTANLWNGTNHLDTMLRNGASQACIATLLTQYPSVLRHDTTFRALIDLGSPEILDQALSIGLQPNSEHLVRKLSAEHIELLAKHGFDPLDQNCVVTYLLTDLRGWSVDPIKRQWQLRLVAEHADKLDQSEINLMFIGMLACRGDVDGATRLLPCVKAGMSPEYALKLWKTAVEPNNQKHWLVSFRFLLEHGITAQDVTMPGNAKIVYATILREIELQQHNVPPMSAPSGTRLRL